MTALKGTTMYKVVLLLAGAMAGARAQLTAQSSVAPDLRECYTNLTLLDRNNLPLASMPTLIDIIRRIEDNPNINMDLRQLAVSLLHTYRQDGIMYHQIENNMGLSSNVMPYAPTFHSYYRHKLLLLRIIPNNLQTLANDTLPAELKCALHHMLSTTVDSRLRGDENNCNQLSQYRALRTVRETPSISDDVEILDISSLKVNKNGQIKQYNPNDDVEFNDEYGSLMSEKQILSESQCPILDGVVKTTWGAVSAGAVIAGIAAGAESQQVPVQDLIRGSVLNYPNAQQYVTSIYPATITGDLAEAILVQGTERGSTVSVGTAGGFNSTYAPRHYMIRSTVNNEMTDPEIRGDLDGFILGSSLSSALSTYSSLKLSQLLDMYYSVNGVFQKTLRACNRRTLYSTYLTDNTLLSETYTFVAALDTNMPLRGTITGGLDQLVTSAISNFQSYIQSNLNDLSCDTTDATTHDYRPKTNLYIVVDSTWQYDAVYPAISYLLEAIDVGKFGSSVTLLSSFDGSVIVNTTYSLADFHSQYTRVKHQQLIAGVNLQSSLSSVRSIMYNVLEHEKSQNYVGGNSSVLLYLLSSSNIQNDVLAFEEARILNETVPDLRVLFATSNNQFDNLYNLVRDPYNDIMTVTLTTSATNIEIVMSNLLERVLQIGRRVINPLCGHDYPGDSTSGLRQFDDYIEPGYINFYSIHPNYFYSNNDNRKIRVTRSGTSIGNLVICHSREEQQPRQNSTMIDQSTVTCETLTSTGSIEIGLQNPCDGHFTINSCPRFYLSVQSVVTTTTTYSAFCTDGNLCRFPYNSRYQIQIEDFGCYSGATGVTASLLVVLFALFTTIF